MTPAIYELTAVQVRFGSRVVLDIDTLIIRAGSLHVLTGPNGSGKSTLLGRVGLFEKARPRARDLLRFVRELERRTARPVAETSDPAASGFLSVFRHRHGERRFWAQDERRGPAGNAPFRQAFSCAGRNGGIRGAGRYSLIWGRSPAGGAGQSAGMPARSAVTGRAIGPRRSGKQHDPRKPDCLPVPGWNYDRDGESR